MKKVFLFVIIVGIIGAAGYVAFMGQQYSTQLETGTAEVAATAREFAGQLGQVVKDTDSNTANEVLDFVKEKVDTGALKSQEGMEQAIQEGKERFGVEIQPEDARKIVDTVQQLESVGVSADSLIEEAQKLYQEYGADYVKHVEDAVTDVVKDAASQMADSFVDYVKESVSDTIKNVVSGT